jgi:hypothetical protein
VGRTGLAREQLTANRSSMCGMTEFDGPSPASLSSATVMIFSPARAGIAHSCASGSDGMKPVRLGVPPMLVMPQPAT